MAAGFSLEHINLALGGNEILRDIDVRIPQGEFACLLGASGSGKTTLLRILGGLRRPDSGRVSWNGEPIAAPSPARAMVFQDYSLFPWLSLQANVALAVRKTHPGISRRNAKQTAREYLEMVGLAAAAEKYPFELSGGMRQRGAIARALSTGAGVLLLDEPFGALDPVNRLRLQDLLLRVCRSGREITAVFVTHDVGEALYLGDRVLVLGSNPGRIIADFPVSRAISRADRAEWIRNPEVVRLTAEIGEIFQADVLAHVAMAFKEGGGI